MVAAAYIDVQDLAKVYTTASAGRLLVLSHTSLRVAQHEFVCILGPSGCGKSTILNILSGLDPAYTGRVRVGGSDRASTVGYVFQEPRLLPWLTIEKNVHFALESAGVPRETWQERAHHQLQLARLADFAQSYPHQ